jgi:hypothetical protein
MTISYTNTRGDLLAFQLYHLRRSPVIYVVNGAGSGRRPTHAATCSLTSRRASHERATAIA